MKKYIKISLLDNISYRSWNSHTVYSLCKYFFFASIKMASMRCFLDTKYSLREDQKGKWMVKHTFLLDIFNF